MLQAVRYFNALARATWVAAGCRTPLIEDLKDALKEEGEVEEDEIQELPIEVFALPTPSKEKTIRSRSTREWEAIRREKEKLAIQKKEIAELKKILLEQKKEVEKPKKNLRKSGETVEKTTETVENPIEIVEKTTEVVEEGEMNDVEEPELNNERMNESIEENVDVVSEGRTPSPVFGPKNNLDTDMVSSDEFSEGEIVSDDEMAVQNNRLLIKEQSPPAKVLPEFSTVQSGAVQQSVPDASSKPAAVAAEKSVSSAGAEPVAPIPMPEVKSTAPAVSMLSRLRRSMNKTKKLSAAEIQKMVAKKPAETIVPEESAIVPLEVAPAIGPIAPEGFVPPRKPSVDENKVKVYDWFSQLETSWNSKKKLVNSIRNSGGYVICNPVLNEDLELPAEEAVPKPKGEPKKPGNWPMSKKEKHKMIEQMLRIDAVTEEKRVGPNAAQWEADQADYGMGIVPGKTSEGEAAFLRGKHDKEQSKSDEKEEEIAAIRKKIIPVPYKRYLLEIDPFRETIYNYKHDKNEIIQRKNLLRKKKKQNPEADKSIIENEEKEIALLEAKTLPTLTKSKLAIASFCVRLSMSCGKFLQKWAEDLAHVFELQFLPQREAGSG